MKPNKLTDIDWDSWKPKDPATLLFVRQNDQMLLIRKMRGLGEGKINGPGGKIDPGETPLECAVREVQEELLITPLDPVFAGEVRFQFVDGYSLHVYIYTATQFEGTPTETPEAIPMWFPVDKIPYEEMWADDRLWLPLLLEGTKFSGDFLFDGDTMLDHEVREIGKTP